MIKYNISTLKNGMTLITVPLPHLDSVTTMVAVGAGSRYEAKSINGISHFLEHMFFKGSKKYPTAEIIANLVDGIGAVNNAGTDQEYTFYWIKSAAEKVEFASDILSSMLKEPLFKEEEIEREKGVILEEIRMYQDTPAKNVWDLYINLQFGDQPLGWNVGGTEEIIKTLKRKDFTAYISSLYSPKNMALVYVGKLPKDIDKLAEKYFMDLPSRQFHKSAPYKRVKQDKPKIGVLQKKTDQANIVFGVEGYDRHSEKRYAANLLGTILGGGMSSRLFLQVREKRGLAYSVSAGHHTLIDTGIFAAYAGLKLEKVEEGIAVIKSEMIKMVSEKVGEQELKKAKEVIRGRLALRSESTNFLAEYFGLDFVLDRKVETFEEYLKKIDAVTAEDIQKVAAELFQKNRFNLQVIGPFKSAEKFQKILEI
ncbi:hypothetical protein A3A14_02235 [Candidatus Daviesbacteria bacterium RIFCSPLOWO2_01_FULL_43_38]|nr:MAG: hypothetical protein A2874_04150 [Candidatus Daviesbacteria bacterium RIFCSPHIGHO2_01_FULL_43_17]OGE63855.1 MAG: hypothetical protein A3A14_02235 [Candidatus Daviesbacteria bacterium RIFCSPLOWO2_01_FULL_43_38]